MTSEQTPSAAESWPQKVGRGWNTSDGYRFFNESLANRHQGKVDSGNVSTDDPAGEDS